MQRILRNDVQRLVDRLNERQQTLQPTTPGHCFLQRHTGRGFALMKTTEGGGAEYVTGSGIGNVLPSRQLYAYLAGKLEASTPEASRK